MTKNPSAHAEDSCPCRRSRISLWVWKIAWRRAWQYTPVFSPGGSHEQRNLAGSSPQVCKESEMTEAAQHTCIYLLSIKPSNSTLRYLFRRDENVSTEIKNIHSRKIKKQCQSSKGKRINKFFRLRGMFAVRTELQEGTISS